MPDRLEKVRQEQLANKENPRYDGTCRNLDPDEARRRVEAGEKYVIRFKIPKEGSTTAVDLLRGSITVENSALDDFVLFKSDGLPTYHMAAMIDDHLMGITHVIRGSEWLSTFALHANIIRAFGWDEPIWVHLSVFLKPSGKGKMSKREAAVAIKDGHSIFLSELKDLGYTPEGVLNWIVLMGWGVAEDDVMTLDQMVERFSIDSLTPSPTAINFQKLDHFNGTPTRLLANEDLSARLKPYFVEAGLEVQNDALLKISPSAGPLALCAAHLPRPALSCQSPGSVPHQKHAPPLPEGTQAGGRGYAPVRNPAMAAARLCRAPRTCTAAPGIGPHPGVGGSPCRSWGTGSAASRAELPRPRHPGVCTQLRRAKPGHIIVDTITRLYPKLRERARFMRVSTRSDYGLRALIEMAGHFGEGPIQSSDIALRRHGGPLHPSETAAT